MKEDIKSAALPYAGIVGTSTAIGGATGGLPGAFKGLKSGLKIAPSVAFAKANEEAMVGSVFKSLYTYRDPKTNETLDPTT